MDTQQEDLLEKIVPVIPSLSDAQKLTLAKTLYDHGAAWNSESESTALEDAVTEITPKARIIGLLAPRDRSEFLAYISILLTLFGLSNDTIAYYLVTPKTLVPAEDLDQDDDQGEDEDDGEGDEDDGDDEDDAQDHGHRARVPTLDYATVKRWVILPGPAVRFRGKANLKRSVLWCLVVPEGKNSTRPDKVTDRNGYWNWTVDAKRNSRVWFFMSPSSEAQTVRRLGTRVLRESYFSSHAFHLYQIIHLPRNRVRVQIEVTAALLEPASPQHGYFSGYS